MKKFILSMLAAAFGVIALQAQEIPERKRDDFKPHEKHRVHHKKDLADLNLSEEQKTKLKALNQEHRQQLEALRKQDNITVKEYREKMEAIRKDHKSKFQSVLTTEQKASMEKMRAGQKERMQQKGRERGERMKKELNLTADQSSKMDASRKAMVEKMKVIREDKSLTDEQKKEKSKELMKQHKESMKSILTEEQLKKMRGQ